MRTKRNTADALENLQLCSMYMCLLRTRYLLSQQEYARLIGTSATNIWSIERGQHFPGPAIVTRIARTFGVSADWLFGLSPRDTNEETLAKSEDVMLKAEGAGSEMLHRFPRYKDPVSRKTDYSFQARKDILAYASILNFGAGKFSPRVDAKNRLQKLMENGA